MLPARPSAVSRTGRAVRGAALLAIGCAAASPGRAAELDVIVIDGRGRPLADAVVSVQVGPPSAAPPGTLASIDQRDRRFAPDIIAVQTGTAVEFPNSDDVRHHVYSFSRPNDFQIKLYHGVPGETVRFEHAGIVTLGCNIHDGMVGHIAVVDTPFLAVTGEDGHARLDVPAGDHPLTAWHPDAESLEMTVRVAAGDAPQRVGVALVARPAAAQPANPLQGLFADR